MSFEFEDDDLKPPKGCSKYEYFDWYDHDKVAKLNERRSREWLKIYKNLKEAREKTTRKHYLKRAKPSGNMRPRT